MTSRTTEIQTLIADIDSLLTNKRLSRFLSSEREQPRKVLEKIRNFLEAQIGSTENQQQLQSQPSSLLSRFADQNNSFLLEQNQTYSEQGSINQPDTLALSVLLAPLQAELRTLLEERANLVQEIRELEQRRLQNYSLAQQLANQEKIIADFLQVLTNRLHGNFQFQMPETLPNSPQQLLPLGIGSSSIIHNKGNPEIASASPLLEPQQQLERLTSLASELDRRLLALDGTVNVVFEALQRNIHTYHESLSQALARMYSKGLQGEQLLTNLINNVQLQIASQEPFTIDIQKEALPSEQKTLQSGNTRNQLTDELLKSTPVDTSDSLTNNPQETDAQLSEDTSTTADIEAVLLQLNQDTQNSSDTAIDSTTDQLHQDSSVSIRDEVDQLYASLFGIDNLIAANSEITPQEENIQVPDVTDELSVDAQTTTNQEQESEFVLQEIEFAIPDVTDELSVDAQTTTNQEQESEFVLQEIDFEIPDVIDELSVDSQTTTNQEQESEFVPQEINFEVPELTNELSVDAQTVANPQKELELFLQEIDFEIPDVIDELSVDAASSYELNTTNITPAPSTNEVQTTDSGVAMTDPWFDEPDAGLLEVSNSNPENTQAASRSVREQLLDLWNKITFVENTESLPVEQPPTADTIALLTELSIDVSTSEQLSEVAFAENSASTTPDQPETEAATINNQNLNESSEQFIPASSQENLLLQAENQNVAIPEISLNEELLQQLERDLASFDEQVYSYLQSATDLEQQEAVENKLPTNLSNPQLAETEKKKEATTDSYEVAVPSDSNFVIDTEIERQIRDSVWYLGIDLGTTGISATLLNRSTTEIFPLYWFAENQPQATSRTQTFRLPAEVYLPPTATQQSETETTEAQEQGTSTTPNLFSAQLKPYLQIALPYRNERQKWEPVLQLNEVATVPLVWVVRSLSKLLLTLKSDRSSTTLGLTAAAVGLNQQSFHSAIDNLAGVICTCPSNWSEQYRFNVREALLVSKIIQHPQQVFFVEEAIASLLSELDGASGEIIQFGSRQDAQTAKTSDHPLIGSTLVINIGAVATEMALVDLPENLDELTHSDFMLHSFAYAGKGIEQDIICQLLLPTKWRQPHNPTQENSNNDNSRQWQPAIPGIERMSFSSLGLENLTLPRPGEPDTSDRIYLQQRLESSFLGKAILDAAVALKLILQHQESFTLELADQRWLLQRRDLESHVFVPFVRRLNRELNKLLVAKGIPTEAINQAILTGGTASLGAVSRWLRQKLPNAKIIQDLYLGENGTPCCSRVAYGLAMLPLHPQVLEVPRQQYTDYFLFTELLRLIPDRALSFNEIIQLFEARGINTRSCQQRLLAFLEGELPAGLMPNGTDSSWLNLTSRENFDYKAIANTPLFEKQGSLTYRPNPPQLQSLRRYLDLVKASTQQSLEEPYTVNFVLGVVH
ncbi:hypothetical protein [Fischerella sp. PCC 9605]|uniref:hypothetical protein n=1 Tax=Fischerella sp. PCC 9605 TaxID=1173024 RepID=UPI00047E711D|nr:hypothetical protein [Fischerella sp. PCC 9605]